MSYHCENCQSLFFKTLETRLCSENPAILYKKRCKRCKYKYIIRKGLPNGQITPASREEWLEAEKVNLPGQASVSERGKILVSEYTRKVSNPADRVGAYLGKIRQAELGGCNHDTP